MSKYDYRYNRKRPIGPKAFLPSETLRDLLARLQRQNANQADILAELRSDLSAERGITAMLIRQRNEARAREKDLEREIERLKDNALDRTRRLIQQQQVIIGAEEYERLKADAKRAPQDGEMIVSRTYFDSAQRAIHNLARIKDALR